MSSSNLACMRTGGFFQLHDEQGHRVEGGMPHKSLPLAPSVVHLQVCVCVRGGGRLCLGVLAPGVVDSSALYFCSLLDHKTRSLAQASGVSLSGRACLLCSIIGIVGLKILVAVFGVHATDALNARGSALGRGLRATVADKRGSEHSKRFDKRSSSSCTSRSAAGPKCARGSSARSGCNGSRRHQ
jgi:hypothetical protein